MKNKNHLPMYGVGPLYVISILIITISFILLDVFHLLDSLKFIQLQIPFIIIGSLLIILGVTLWVLAVFQSKIDREIENNQLVTTGVYAWCRNPIYSAFIFIFTGILLFFYNLYLLIPPIIFYIYLTILMKYTEEKWLQDTFKEAYLDYCKKVNRIIPFFPRKK